jgi:hypothetical protein
MPLARSFFRHHLRLALVVVLISPLILAAHAQQHDPRVTVDLRTISGTVTDSGHEPIRNAIVELENPANHEVISFITAADGHYIFNRLDSHTDFQVWATFRGHKSVVHNISMYDSHMDKVINIVCKDY